MGGIVRAVSAPRFRQDNFAQELVHAVPEFERVFAEHLEDMNGEILNHLLSEDLVRFVKAARERGDQELVRQVLAFIDQAFQDADDYVVNVIEVSFVESFAYWDPDERAFIATWPVALMAESHRQEACAQQHSGRTAPSASGVGQRPTL